jgi:hypothetical protein
MIEVVLYGFAAPRCLGLRPFLATRSPQRFATGQFVGRRHVAIQTILHAFTDVQTPAKLYFRV